MQELDTDTCKAASALATDQLMDVRDGKKYWVTKLADGNCWMTQNLDYDDPGSTRINAPSGWTTSAVTNTTAAYYDPGEKIVSGSNLVDATTTTDRHLLVGNYYSYIAATAGTGASVTNDGGNAGGSICPGGWKLPTSKVTTNGSFGGLTSGISAGSTLVGQPYYFQYGGRVNSGSLQYAGSEGRYWSSTANNSTGAYDLYFYSGGVNPSNTSNRYFGLSVRCLVQGS